MSQIKMTENMGICSVFCKDTFSNNFYFISIQTVFIHAKTSQIDPLNLSEELLLIVQQTGT